MLENKNITKTINIKDIDLPYPNLKNVDKTSTIVEWFIDWIESALKANKIQHNDQIPSKTDFAYTLGVSLGTIQNAIRAVEDKGYLVSKQKKGTFINASGQNIKKLTSKRDCAIESIKKYIIEQNIEIGQLLPSARKLATELDITVNTMRSAFQGLISEGILEKNEKQEFILKNKSFESNERGAQTLVEKIKNDIEQYLVQNCKMSEKIPTNAEFSKMFNVGLKTVNDAIQLLVENGVLVTLRGKYGTIYTKQPNSKGSFEPPRETSIFAPAATTAYYYYEKTKQKIKRMILDDYHPGAKLPTILKLAKMFDLSPNTVRRAIKELTKEGILVSSPGRWGGTFVISRPAEEEPSYQWLAVSSEYVASEN